MSASDDDDCKVVIAHLDQLSPEEAAKALEEYLDSKVHSLWKHLTEDNEAVIPEGLTEMGLSEFMAIGRDENCTCGHIQCVCHIERGHKEDCPFRIATCCAIPIECDHGYDVCPQCDPCTC